jgi:predicted GNAT superfamily acetyltransferase
VSTKRRENRDLTPYHVRPLTTIEECRQVVALEREVWGYTDSEDVVPPPVLIVSIKRGGILLGAFATADALKGFVYSMPSIVQGRPAQWSHMLGVAADARGAGLGLRLKVAQREAALDLGIDLIEWTFDPLQTTNAHLNFARLGVVAEEYVENVYGDSSSPLHRGVATDRLIAQWRLREPHVERRLSAPDGLLARDSTVGAAPVINPSAAGADWRRPGPADLAVDARRVLVEVPVGFSDMLRRDPPLAIDWRTATRDIFTTYFARGYCAVDFFRGPDAGHYLLAQKVPGSN